MSKVIFQFKAIGNAPILKQPFYKLSGSNQFASVKLLLLKLLGLKENDLLVLYINSSFAPMPDAIVQDLYDCYGVDGSLICNYSTTVAFG